MILPRLIDMVRADWILTRYQDNTLWYQATISVYEPTDTALQHPKPQIMDVPIDLGDDTGGAFLRHMRGIELTRWIRRHHEALQKALEEHEAT